MTCENCDPKLNKPGRLIEVTDDMHFCAKCLEPLSAPANTMELHVRALACHCECLALNTANMFAVCNNQEPPYPDTFYLRVMEKWGMVDEDGSPTFKI